MGISTTWTMNADPYPSSSPSNTQGEPLAACGVAPTTPAGKEEIPSPTVSECQNDPGSEEPSWKSVDPRMQTIWWIQAAFLPAILLGISLGLLLLGHFKGWTIVRAVAGSAGVGLLVLLWYYPSWWARRLFARTSYRMGAEVFERQQGIMWQETLAIPLNRLQHVDLTQSPLDRMLGLATLSLYTAGSRSAVHKVSGLPAEQAQMLRKALLTKVSDAQHL
jgi:hypothetical protein